MIYVILEPRINTEITIKDLSTFYNYQTELCIKIGYSSDFDKRKVSYTSDTPRFDLLYTYESGTIIDEKKLHKYFEKYKTTDLNGEEWFKFDKEFIEFFNNNPTIEDIRSKISHIELLSKKEIKDYQTRAEKIILSFVYLQLDLGIKNNNISFEDEDLGELEESFQNVIKSERLFNYYIERVRPRTDMKFLEFLKGELSGSDYNLLVDSYNKRQEKLTSISKDLDTFNVMTNYIKKMEYVCSYGNDKTDEEFNLFLNSIPKSFKNYYTVLGPAKCKAHKYQQASMEKEYQRLLNNQGVSLEDRIYDTFHAGDRLKRTDIKTMLEKIYQDSGFQATAKAVDLKKWFNLKEIQFRVKGTNIREAGFELISRTIPPTP